MTKIHPRLWLTSNDGLIEYVSLTKNRLKETLEVVRKGFFMDEEVSVAVGLNKDPKAIKELDDYIIDTAMDGVSIVAKDKGTGNIIGCMLNKINVQNHFSESPYGKFKLQHPAAQAWMEFYLELDRKVKPFDLLKTNCYVEHGIATMLPEFRERGIANQLGQVTENLIACLVNNENVKVPLDDKALSLNPIPTASFVYATHRSMEKLAVLKGYRKVAEIDLSKCNFKNELLTSVLDQVPIAVMCKYLKKH